MPAVMIRLEGDAELMRAVDRRYLLVTPINTFQKRSGDATRQALQRESPVGRTKKLSRSWKITYRGGDPISGFIVENTDPKAEMVLGGTRPHDILPRHPAEALSWPSGRHPVSRVRHPGTRPINTVSRARDIAAREIDGPIRAALDADVQARWDSRGYGG